MAAICTDKGFWTRLRNTNMALRHVGVWRSDALSPHWSMPIVVLRSLALSSRIASLGVLHRSSPVGWALGVSKHVRRHQHRGACTCAQQHNGLAAVAAVCAVAAAHAIATVPTAVPVGAFFCDALVRLRPDSAWADNDQSCPDLRQDWGRLRPKCARCWPLAARKPPKLGRFRPTLVRSW